MTIIKLEMTISKKEDKKHVEVGKVEYFLPLLATFGISAEQDTGEDGKPLYEDGIPVYKLDHFNWLQSAIHAQVKVATRNKLEPGTATLRPGLTIPDTLEAITAEGDRAGNAAALKQVADLKKAFAAWVAGLGKSAQAQQLLNSLFGSKQSLMLQDASTKGKMSSYIAQFAESLPAEQLEKGQRYLESLLTLCNQTIAADDF